MATNKGKAQTSATIPEHVLLCAVELFPTRMWHAHTLRGITPTDG